MRILADQLTNLCCLERDWMLHLSKSALCDIHHSKMRNRMKPADVALASY